MNSVEIREADVIFYRPKGFIGKVISKISKSEYSHVSIAVGDGVVLEATRFVKSRLSGLTYDKEIHHVYRLNNLSPKDVETIVQNALTLQGVKYDYKQIVGMFFKVLFNLEKSPFNNLNKFICSEIIDKAFIMSGIPRADKEHILDITPQELLDKYDLQRVY